MDNVPRLEVINTFEDYADYQPEHDAPERLPKKAKRQKKKHTIPLQLNWEDDYDPMRPVDFEEYLLSDERQEARRAWELERTRLGLHKTSRGEVTTEHQHSIDDDLHRKPSYRTLALHSADQI